jgi:CelD/BcsL family acetyltransferase involved in cellulose biosynthesis
MIPGAKQVEGIVNNGLDSSQGYSIQRISTVEELDQIQHNWTGLANEALSSSLFLTWEWGRTWWRHFGDAYELCMLAAWDRAGELAGLAPLMIVQDSLGPLKSRRLTFLSNGLASPDHMDILVRPGEEEQVAAGFLVYLHIGEIQWDVLDLNNQAPDSIASRALINSGYSYYESSRKELCPYIQLPTSWEEYLSKLSQKRRSRVRQYRKRIEKEYPSQVRFRMVDEPREILDSVRYISASSREYWDSKGHDSAFHDDRFEAFHCDMAMAAHQQGWLRLHKMEVNGEVIASEYNFRYGDVVYGYQGVFDRSWADYSPGLILLTHAFEKAIEEGVKEFDFLRGDEEYKFYWTDEVRQESRFIHARTRQGRAWLAVYAAADRGIVLAKNFLSKDMQKKANKLVSLFQRRKKQAVD